MCYWWIDEETGEILGGCDVLPMGTVKINKDGSETFELLSNPKQRTREFVREVTASSPQQAEQIQSALDFHAKMMAGVEQSQKKGL